MLCVNKPCNNPNCLFSNSQIHCYITCLNSMSTQNTNPPFIHNFELSWFKLLRQSTLNFSFMILNKYVHNKLGK